MYFIFLFLMSISILNSQQVVDSAYSPYIDNTSYKPGKGPVVAIDAGHNNLHTAETNYLPFANLLRRDGYRISTIQKIFTPATLSEIDILVIANPLHSSNINNWTNPCPSAFTQNEIISVRKWVKNGGKLFLIADHMPYGGASKELAATFGFEFTNGFAIDTNSRGRSLFTNLNGSLATNEITQDLLSQGERRIYSFTGQAFRIPISAIPILTFGNNHINYLPETAWEFTQDTPTENANGMHQLAAMRYGIGKVVMGGEAAMFTGQLIGPNQYRIGMNSDFATGNHKLLLAIMKWLTSE